VGKQERMRYLFGVETTVRVQTFVVSRSNRCNLSVTLTVFPLTAQLASIEEFAFR
jgi:hypothetical protein